jgi:hypothetical protein
LLKLTGDGDCATNNDRRLSRTPASLCDPDEQLPRWESSGSSHDFVWAAAELFEGIDMAMAEMQLDRFKRSSRSVANDRQALRFIPLKRFGDADQTRLRVDGEVECSGGTRFTRPDARIVEPLPG